MKMDLPKVRDADFFNAFSRDHLPGYLGVRVTEVTGQTVTSELAIQPHHLAPNGYLHAGVVVALADTTAAYACVVQLPDGAGFTTVELKSNHVDTAHDGMITCTASPLHLGRTTQVWDAQVSAGESAAPGKLIAAFRCTQLILHLNPKIR